MLVPASSFHSEREKGTKSDIGNWLIKKKKKWSIRRKSFGSNPHWMLVFLQIF